MNAQPCGFPPLYMLDNIPALPLADICGTGYLLFGFGRSGALSALAVLASAEVALCFSLLGRCCEVDEAEEVESGGARVCADFPLMNQGLVG